MQKQAANESRTSLGLSNKRRLGPACLYYRHAAPYLESLVLYAIENFTASAGIYQSERDKHVPNYFTISRLVKVLGASGAFLSMTTALQSSFHYSAGTTENRGKKELKS